MSAPLHYQYLADFAASTGSIEDGEDGAYHTPEARGGGREPQGVACDHVPSPALPSDTHSRARKPHQMRRPNPCPQKESLIKPTYLLAEAAPADPYPTTWPNTQNILHRERPKAVRRGARKGGVCGYPDPDRVIGEGARAPHTHRHLIPSGIPYATCFSRIRGLGTQTGLRGLRFTGGGLCRAGGLGAVVLRYHNPVPCA